MTRVALVRSSLWASFAFNLIAAYILANPTSSAGVIFGLAAGTDLLYRALVGYLVAVFGLSYAWLAMQSNPHQPLLVLGAVGKAGVFLIATWLWLSDAASAALVGLASGDLALSLFWAWSLIVSRVER